MKITKFPYQHFALKQTEFESNPELWYACGICAFYSALKLVGMHDRTPFNIHKKFVLLKGSENVLRREGVSTEEMILVANEIGYRIESYPILKSRNGTWKEIMAESNRGKAILIFPPNHSVTLWAATPRGAWIMDPDNLNQSFRFTSPKKIFEYWDDSTSSGVDLRNVAVLYPSTAVD